MRIDVLGVGFDALDRDAALDRAQAWLDGGTPRYIVTPNAEIAYAALRDAALRDALNGADMVLPDGIGIVKASRQLGRPLRERVPGAEFGPGLAARMAAQGKRLYLLGAKPGVAEEAADRLRREHPGLVVCGARDGYFQDDADVLADIARAKPDVIFVCLGAPKQELWMRRNLDSVGPALMLGLGGTLDMLAGRVKRAPAVFRKLGLEWLYRLAHPSRWRRAAALPRFVMAVRRQRRHEKKGR
ncbi:MAG: WecB/TagA/CpsF family glycosyltransferase [Oscillospiraceae bacterium]|nr:WecB/TagA/CpsF family glycosyltransferase [Oscillospiraceae bacterium]